MTELLEILESRGVEYAVVGGFAVNFYGYIRNTQDLDILIFPSTDNAERVMAALAECATAVDRTDQLSRRSRTGVP